MQVLFSPSDKVNRFLDSIGRNSLNTKYVYKIGLSYLEEFLHNKQLNSEVIIPLLKGQGQQQQQQKQFNDVYELLDQFVSYLRQNNPNLSNTSIKLYVVSVRSYLEYFDIDIVPSKFRRRVKMPKLYKEDELPLDIADVRNLLVQCHNRRLKAFLLVLATSGVRTMEACILRIKDVDFSIIPTKIHVRKEFSKTRRSRDVYISYEATNCLQDIIKTKFKPQPDDLIFSKLKQGSQPRSIYFRLSTEFEKLLTRAEMDARKDNSHRHKITMHSFRRFVKGVVSDTAGSDYSEWFLGHNHSVYWTRKELERRNIYLEKCLPYLTILDYSSLDKRSKNIEVALKEKDKAIQQLTIQMKEMQEHQNEMRALLRNPKKLREMIQENNN